MELRSILLFALIVLAAGCHPRPKPVAAAAHPPAAPAEGVTPGQFPSGWPDFIPAYPGALIVAGVEGKAQKQGMPILSATLTTADEAARVHEFYGRQVSQHEFTLSSSNETNGEKVSLYQRGSQSFSVSTSRDDSQGITNVELTLVGTYEPHPGESPASPPDQPPVKADDQKDGKKEERKTKPVSPLLPVYPGAEADQPKSNGSFVSVHMSTDDPLEQVIAYYEQFYKSQGFSSGGRTDFDTQSSETFTGMQGTVSLNVQKRSSSGGKSTSINLSLEARQ